MAPTVQPVVPSEFRAGDTVRFTRVYADYPTADGWTVVFTLAGPGRASATAAVSNGAYDFTLAIAKTTDLPKGTYTWAITATLAGARYTVETGVINVLADVASAAAGTLQDEDEAVLALLTAEIRARAASDHTEYTVGDRSLKRESLVELRRWASQLRSRIARRKAGGRVPMVAVNFTRRGLA